MNQPVRDLRVSSWEEINVVLDRFTEMGGLPTDSDGQGLADRLAGGVAFVTYSYGIDGVTIEIAKYARCLEEIAHRAGVSARIHYVGGNFYPEADNYLKPHCPRLHLPNFDGWDKWDGGVWFNRMFRESMPEGSERSGAMAAEVWRQAIGFADTLCDMIRERGITLLIPVNVNANPGNLAASLAVVLASEMAGVDVLNSNHDFFWEGGAPPEERAEGETGVRDHFFRNCRNSSFFRLFERILPWNGTRWTQVNINRQQTDRLIDRYGFSPEKVFQFETAIADEFFNGWTQEEKILKRLTMACVLNSGKRIINPVPVDRFLGKTSSWMKNQTPIVCGACDGIEFDMATPSAFYLLQPTRVIPKKRIDLNWRLIQSLLAYGPFRTAFEEDPDRTLTLHVTGPVPIEHQEELEKILTAYRDMLCSIPESLARRVFIAFSVGNDDHPSLKRYGLKKLSIEDIYHLSDLVLFPSETEGRGLPILEATAAGLPVVCSRYRPETAFCEVVGENLKEEYRIRYTPFPGGEIGRETLKEVTDLLLHGERHFERAAHNRYAVAVRYNERTLLGTVEAVLQAAVSSGSRSVRYV
jgi:glycosyltransferase involved in cell wall biosynthesis